MLEPSVSCVETDVLNDRTWFGRFQISPLRSGVGTTVANSLRRSLLYDVPGYGITWVDIDGAAFPFSVLKGVRESVLEISLNLQKVRILSWALAGYRVLLCIRMLIPLSKANVQPMNLHQATPIQAKHLRTM